MHVSGAVSSLNTESSAVLLTELCVAVFTSWRFLMVIPSIPDGHNWPSGMAPPCEVSPMGNLGIIRRNNIEWSCLFKTLR